MKWAVGFEQKAFIETVIVTYGWIYVVTICCSGYRTLMAISQ